MSEALDRTVAEWRAKVAATGMRAWREWTGKTGDTAIPPRVQARICMVWENTCHITGVKIAGERPQMEHVVPLNMGGENREGNIRPAWKKAHQEKSAAEAGKRAKADRQRANHIGARSPSKATIPSPPKPERPTTKADQIRALREADYARRFGQ